MKDVNCYLCGSSERKEILCQEGHDPYLDVINEELHKTNRCWYQCKVCNFVYRSPALTSEELKQLYSRYEEDVFKDTNPDEFFDRIINLSPHESENYQKSQWLTQELADAYTEEWSPKSLTLLDVGCGSGLLLKTLGDMLDTDYRYGVELNPEYAGLASRRSGATIQQGLFKPGIFNKKFDLVILTKVLEHVPKPDVFVKELVADVKPGGFLFIEVPDVIDFDNLTSSDPRFFIPHIYYFSGDTLGSLLERSNMSVISKRIIVTHRKRSYLQVIAKKNLFLIDD